MNLIWIIPAEGRMNDKRPLGLQPKGSLFSPPAAKGGDRYSWDWLYLPKSKHLKKRRKYV
jgi:hypothetical protein